MESWRKKGGGPCALVTPAESDLVSVLVSAADDVAALVMMMASRWARKRGREDGSLMIGRAFLFVYLYLSVVVRKYNELLFGFALCIGCSKRGSLRLYILHRCDDIKADEEVREN